MLACHCLESAAPEVWQNKVLLCSILTEYVFVAVTAHEVDVPADVAERIPVLPKELEPQVCAESCVLAIVNPFTL